LPLSLSQTHPRSKSGKGPLPALCSISGAEEPVRYVEVPRKAANAGEWLQMQMPLLASADGASDRAQLAVTAEPVTNTAIEG
jgi:hypothetical protein